MKKIVLPFLLLFVLLSFKINDTRRLSGLVVTDTDGLPIAGVLIKSLPSQTRSKTDQQGSFNMTITAKDTHLEFSSIGYATIKIQLKDQKKINVRLIAAQPLLDEVRITAGGQQVHRKELSRSKTFGLPIASSYMPLAPAAVSESYTGIAENEFRKPLKDPYSTFSIDVDAASYSNVRRFINNGQLPPKDAVRIEELVNYFDYAYADPKGNDPVNIVTELGAAPWNKQHRLLHIGLKAKSIDTKDLPPSNLVFLIDVSGSMNAPNKLPLLVSSFKLLTDQLSARDRVAIVVYAGNSGLVLPATPGNEKGKIKDALHQLSAGGSTAGGEGIKLAYKVATENYIKNGNNRIILATDGDFNVGASSDQDMQQLIEQKRKSGIFLSVLGYGMGNYKDSKMEILANKGNGNYAYIDNINEARKVLVNEFGGTLFTVAKDVKLQIEFNPAKVQAYRLIGYENRLLKDEDFNNDVKDAGEIGAGHTVTALYEIIPVGVKSKFAPVIDELKYQSNRVAGTAYSGSELVNIKLRYKAPNGEQSKLMQKAVADQLNPEPSANFRFAAAVAGFGMLLRDSDFKQSNSYDQVIALAESALGKDEEGYRSEFLRLVKSTRLMARDLLNIAAEK